MDTKVKGIILRLIDYKEADKLAKIFSLERGMLTAKFVGVKKEKAKFKGVALPFVFADFTLAEKNDNATVVSADIIDQFSPIIADYTRTMCGYIILEMLYKILEEQAPEQELFLSTINSLKLLETHHPLLTTVDYILKFITLTGEGLQFPLKSTIYLDTTLGNFTDTRSTNCVEIDLKVYNIIKAVAMRKKEFDKNEKTIRMALNLLHNILLIKFNVDIKSFQYVQ